MEKLTLKKHSKVWQKNQREMFDSLRDGGLAVKLGGDARCCSPGHTAKFGSYSFMNLDTSKVLDVQLVQVILLTLFSNTNICVNGSYLNILVFLKSNEVPSSYHMELEGLKRCLSRMEAEGIDISHLVTDRHTQVKSFMKKDQPHITHMFDVWHVAKGIQLIK
jgi:hypothetical protein